MSVSNIAPRLDPRFERFKAGPGAEIAEQIGADPSKHTSWSGWKSGFMRTDRDGLDKRVKRVICSTGEFSILVALLHSLDYSWLADDLCKKRPFWRCMDSTHGDHQQAVIDLMLSGSH